ncbi:MAG: N-acetyl sugar amidotransferase [Leptospira sp.]|nr:N-acetyl sugar amidotransferase [Leptospira sp.]
MNISELQKKYETLRKVKHSCQRCLCDNTISSISYDENGICNYCKRHDLLTKEFNDDSENSKNLKKLVQKIKQDGQKKEYDCIVGVSGGTDSSYTLHLALQLGLRPLAVHFDNGWNTIQSVSNVKAITDKLQVDLETYVVEWEEFKDIQLSFLKASVPCIEVPTDVGIFAVLYKIANQENIKYILGGQSFKTEGTVPKEWSYIDGTYVSTIQKKFGSKKIKSYPNLSLVKLFYYIFLKKIQIIPILNYVDYEKTKAKDLLREIYKWQDYDGHHYENIYSKFAFGWYQFYKFGIDKRKISYSGPIRSGIMNRSEGIKKISEAPHVGQETVDYVINKLGISEAEFIGFYDNKNKTYKDFFTSESILIYFKPIIYLLMKLNMINQVLYRKYFS